MSYMLVLAYNGYQRQRYTLYRCIGIDVPWHSSVKCIKKFIARDLGLEKGVFEGDAETITRAINSDFTCLASFGHIVDAVAEPLDDQGGLAPQNFFFKKKLKISLKFCKILNNLIILTHRTW